ncbi:MAG: non-ribosomal peptide synthetase [Solirubrobacteraceae bacterium]
MTATTAARRAEAPLSVAQEALWYVALLAPNRISYNETISIRKDGPLDLVAFRAAFTEIVRRHQAWRTTFDTVNGQPVQVVATAADLPLPVLDLSHLTPEEAERRAVRITADLSRTPYDVRRGPLLRPRLIRFPRTHHRLYLAMHHLIFDGVSVYRVVLPELVALYDAFFAGRPSPLPEPPTQYGDYARWEQTWIIEPRVARRFAHWRQHLTAVPHLALPQDHPRSETPRFRGGIVPVSVPGETVDRLKEVGQGVGGSLFQVLASMWALLLSRYSSQQDVVFATATDLRQRPELESVVGYSLTPLVLRVDLSGEPTLEELVLRVRNELLDGLDHLIPFERLVRELDPDAAAGANPIYQTMIILEPAVVAADPCWSVHQMESEIGEAVGNAKLDLELELDERPEGHISGRLIYDRDLFEAPTAARMAAHWLRLIEAAAADPTCLASTIPILTPADQRRQLVEWNATTTEIRAGRVDDLVSGRAALHPEAGAVSADGETLNYGELERRATRSASRLLETGARAGDAVALGSVPSLDLIVDALGVLKAGAAYALAATAGSALPAPGQGTLPEAICCLQPTSTATGTPSWVAIRHGAVINLATALAADLGIGPDDTILVLPANLLRAHVMELWMALVTGARIVVASAETAGDGARLSQLIASEGASFLHASPSTWQTLIDTGLKASRGLNALSGGGRLSRELADEILERCRVLWNGYGTVETTGYCTLARVQRATSITIGRPIANTRAYVLDGHDQPVPIGVTGELLVAGEGVAGGYVNRPNLTPTPFVEDPFGPGAAYRTGDQARWRADGELELV